MRNSAHGSKCSDWERNGSLPESVAYGYRWPTSNMNENAAILCMLRNWRPTEQKLMSNHGNTETGENTCWQQQKHSRSCELIKCSFHWGERFTSHQNSSIQNSGHHQNITIAWPYWRNHSKRIIHDRSNFLFLNKIYIIAAFKFICWASLVIQNDTNFKFCWAIRFLFYGIITLRGLVWN